MSRAKVAIHWCSACGGCDETIVDLRDELLELREAVEFVFWPCAMDFKRSDVEALPDGAIAFSLVSGAIRTSEQEEVVRLLRRKSKLVVAFGSCACMGGIPALANLTNRRAIFDRVYGTLPTVENPDGVAPTPKSTTEDGHELDLPVFGETVRRLSDVVDVDCELPGCPPVVETVSAALAVLLEGRIPSKAEPLLPDVALCRSCERNATKPDVLTIREFRRLIHVQADPAQCFLNQGILCMGPATRDGCGFPCVKGNMPCTGCMGPVGGEDQGTRMASALGGILEGRSEERIAEVLDGLPDPAGSLYRYSLGSSLLGRRREEDGS